MSCFIKKPTFSSCRFPWRPLRIQSLSIFANLICSRGEPPHPRIGLRSIVTYHDNYIHQIPEETETFSSTTSENGSVPKTEVEVLPFKVDYKVRMMLKYNRYQKCLKRRRHRLLLFHLLFQKLTIFPASKTMIMNIILIMSMFQTLIWAMNW